MPNSAKENILKKIRQALSEPTPVPFAALEGNDGMFHAPTDELTILFAEQFTQLQGRFHYCETEEELWQQINALITQQAWKHVFVPESHWQSNITAPNSQVAEANIVNCDVAITTAHELIARTGQLVLSSASAGGRTASVYTPVHICVAYTHQIVYDIKDGLQLYKQPNYPSMVSFAAGPSRTADIEKTLVVGVHGPKQVYCFLVESNT